LNQSKPGEASLPRQAGCAGGPTLFSGLERADVPTLTKAVQAISSTLDRNKLIETLLVIALENGGAQRFFRGGFLTNNQFGAKDVDYFSTWLSCTF
jgi:hypothetical protein